MSLRARMERWFLSRHPPSDTLALTQRNIYILPTRAGWMLGLTLLALLVGSINYQLNLGYLLTFLLAGCVAVGMHASHATLRGLTMHLNPPAPQYAGAAAIFDITLHNTRRRIRHGIGLAVRGSGHWAFGDVPAQGSSTIGIAFSPPRRGLHPVPPITAETRFPLGTFRVWTVWRPAAQLLVYPVPEAHPPPLPSGEPIADHAAPVQSTRAQTAGEFDGLRIYRSGDPLKMLAWKRIARAQAAGSDELFSRDTQQTQRRQLWLDARHTGLADTEAQLSRLCAWVGMADRLGVDYGLRVNNLAIAPSQGETHRRRCLEVLATC